jgi:hypothetical protein
VDTIEPSTRPYAVFAGILADGTAMAGASGTPGADRQTGAGDFPDPPLSDALAAELHVAAEALNVAPPAGAASADAVPSGPDLTGPPPVLVARAFAVFTQLFGAVSFEIFGRLNNVIDERRDWFDWQMRSMAAYLGLVPRR